MTASTGRAPRLIRAFPASLIALATGANVRTAERWRAGQAPQRRYRDRMSVLQAVLDVLGRGVSASAKRAWLEAPSPFLDFERPVDRLAAGDFAAVHAAAESYVVGDYA
jgi:uncharacterized protein (DUF2384 family)